MSEFKFTQGYDLAFLGAEPFENGEEPFYAYFREYAILITLYGIDLYGYDVETDKEWRYYNNDSDNKISYEEALDYVKLIETNPAAFIKLAKLSFNYEIL